MTDHGMVREELPGSRREKREWDPRAADEEPAVGIPQWGRDWWWLVAITGTILFLLLAATEGWVLAALVFAFAGGIIALTCQKVLSRRRVVWAERRRQELCERSCLEKADLMSGTQFEHLTAALLQLRGYSDVQVIGRSRDGGIDVLAVDPVGQPVAVQCKRQADNVRVGVVRQLIGAIAHDFRGRAGILVTTAGLTRDADALARRCPEIDVIDRTALAGWMGEARRMIEAQSELPLHTQRVLQMDALRSIREVVLEEQQRVPTRGGEPSTEHRLAAGLRSGRQGLPKAPARAIAGAVLFGAAAFVLLYLISVSKPPAAARVQRPIAVHASANTSAPARVVQEYFAAINEHDWQVVWRLWAGNHEPGHGSAYEHMIAGFRLTRRDIITKMSTHGDAVSVNVLAYETTGAVQGYRFSYVVHGGVIVEGKQTLIFTRS
jgi:restriction system protein